MRTGYIIVLLALYCGASAQSKEIATILAASRELENIVFGTKDSIKLEKLFAGYLTYGHSNGKVETREEAIRNIVRNKSVYVKKDTLAGYSVIMNRNAAVVRHPFLALEKKEDGTVSELHLAIVLVWVREKKDWKLLARQAVKIQ